MQVIWSEKREAYKNMGNRIKKTKRKNFFIIALMIGVFIIAFFFVRLYMQYQWTDKLVIAIQTEDEQKVDELLAQRFCGQPYDVDKKAHQPFPLSLFGELERP